MTHDRTILKHRRKQSLRIQRIQQAHIRGKNFARSLHLAFQQIQVSANAALIALQNFVADAQADAEKLNACLK